MTVTRLADRPLSARALTELLGDWRAAHDVAYLGLSARIQLLITEGRILAGTRLPAERPLAASLGVSRTTVVSAYGALRDDGYLVSAQGSGSVVTAGQRTASAGIDRNGIDFTMAAPAALDDLSATYARALADLPSVIGGAHFDLVGTPELRTAIAARYTQRGLPTEPDEIVVTMGAQHAIFLLARALLTRGDRALVEAPTYPHAAEALEAAGGRLATIPVHTDGWDIDQAIHTIERTQPRLGYLMPSFHNPTGASMSPAAREAILAACERTGTTLIVDETAGEFTFDGSPVTPFAAHATEEQRSRIVTIGSVGKTVWGGVRVGWIRANTTLLRRVLAVRPYGDLGTPAVEQLLVANYLPRIDPILQARSRDFAANADRIHSFLATNLPEWTMPELSGGISAWVNLGAPLSSSLAAAARERGLRITSGPRFGVDGAFERHIRIPLTNTPEQVDAGLAILRDTWVSLRASTSPQSPLLAESVI